MGHTRSIFAEYIRKSLRLLSIVGAFAQGLSNAEAQAAVTPCMRKTIPCQSARSIGNNSVPVPYAIFNSMFPSYTPASGQRPDGPFGRGMVQMGGYVEPQGANLLHVDSDGVDTLFVPARTNIFKSEFSSIGDVREIAVVGSVYQLISPDNSRITYAKFSSRFHPVSGQDHRGHRLFDAEYSPNGALRKFTEQNGSITTFELNPSINKITRARPSFGPDITFEYQNGYLSKVSQPGRVVELSYDIHGNVSRVVTTPSTAPSYSVTFSYAPHNVLTEFSDSLDRKVSIAYAGSVVTRAVSVASTGELLETTKTAYRTFASEASGSLARYSVPVKVESIEGADSQPGMVTYLATLDTVGKPLSISDATTLTTSYDYSGGSPFPTTITYPDGRSVVITRNPSKKYRVEAVQERGAGGNGPVVSRVIGWNTLGTPSRTEISVNGTNVQTSVISEESLEKLHATTTTTKRLSYNDTTRKGRIAQVVDPSGVTAYTYDPRGRVTGVTTNGVSTTLRRSSDANGTVTTTIGRAGVSFNASTDYRGKSVTQVFRSPGLTATTTTGVSNAIDETTNLPKSEVRTMHTTSSMLHPSVKKPLSRTVVAKNKGGRDSTTTRQTKRFLR